MLKPAPSVKAETLLCPSCNAPMMLVQVTPRLGGMAELHTYECKTCSAVLTEAADDRLNSGAYRRLLSKGSDASLRNSDIFGITGGKRCQR